MINLWVLTKDIPLWKHPVNWITLQHTSRVLLKSNLNIIIKNNISFHCHTHSISIHLIHPLSIAQLQLHNPRIWVSHKALINNPIEITLTMTLLIHLQFLILALKSILTIIKVWKPKIQKPLFKILPYNPMII